MEEIKDKIAARRKALGITQEQLAQKIGFRAKVISKWETGRSLPDTVFLPDICRELQISPAELLFGTGPEAEGVRGQTGVRRPPSPFVAAGVVWVLSLLFAAVLIGAGIAFLTGYYDETVPAAVCLLLGLFVLLGGIAAFIILRSRAAARSSLAADKKNAFRLSVCIYLRTAVCCCAHHRAQHFELRRAGEGGAFRHSCRDIRADHACVRAVRRMEQAEKVTGAGDPAGVQTCRAGTVKGRPPYGGRPCHILQHADYSLFASFL